MKKETVICSGLAIICLVIGITIACLCEKSVTDIILGQDGLTEKIEKAHIRQGAAYKIKSKEADKEILEFCQHFRNINPSGSTMPDHMQGLTLGSVSQEGIALEVLIEYKKWKGMNVRLRKEEGG